MIRRATVADLAAIEAIQSASPEAAHWNAADYLSYDCFVAVVDGSVAGFLVSRPIADEREILNVAVAPEFRRRSIASALVRHELGTVGKAWFLEVRESNEAAVRLYKSFGFNVVGKRSEYYQTPPESAIVMRFFS
jgi:ribosomal-protein-alanine N-acetyltransferase